MKLLLIFASLLAANIRESLAVGNLSQQTQCNNASISRDEVETFLKDSKFGDVGLDFKSPGYDLYTSRNINERQILRHDDVETLRNSNFNPNWPVRFSIQGWTGRSTACSNLIIKDAYLSAGEFNVILVDWSDVALQTDNLWLEGQLPQIAAEIAQFIQFLKTETHVEMSQIYLIGHGRGCQISGLIAKILNPEKLGAIVALDPIGLTKLDATEAKVLAPDDALYVESIHSDVSGMRYNFNPISQAAFFPNWAQRQAHCSQAATTTTSDLECSHFASVYYFAESIRHPKSFGALKCPGLSSILKYQNCKCSSGGDKCAADVYMGGEPLVPKTGVFYLSTRSNSPFGLADIVQFSMLEMTNLDIRKKFSIRSGE